MKKNITFLLLIVVLLSIIILFFYKRNTTDKLFIFEGFTQGTYYKISYFANDSLVKQQELENLLNDFLLTASLWEPNSIISQVNDNKDVDLNTDFIKIFETAQLISAQTNGAFDITVGKLVNLWGFGSRKETKQPDQKVIDSIKQFTGFENVKISNNKVAKTYLETSLDFNAIAKGYSVDMISEFLSQKELKSYLVDIGGEIRACGLKPKSKKWVIAIERPTENDLENRPLQKKICLTNKSIATSGTYRNYYEKDSIKYSHTIDPHTGYPITHNLLSVSVIADDCMTADAYATAFMVMGKDKALNYIEAHQNVAAYFIFSGEDGKFKTDYSKNFEPFIIH